ncbi:MAG TPA: DUF4366 domain-containing protein [Enterococcus sp.]|nr:DUF4366 domain-containing protein [Enterococcus sp.]
MKSFKKAVLFLLLFSFSIGSTSVFAEDKEKKNKIEETTTDSDLAEAESKLKEDPVNREKEILKMPIETPASVTGEKFNGSGTVVDFTTTGSKAFYTVQTTNHSVYYIIIDLDKTESNVYFLSEINGEELSLNDVASKEGITNKEPVTATINKVQKVEETEKVEQKAEAATTTKTSSKGNWSLWILLIAAVFLFGYQFFFGKLKNLNPLIKKKQLANTDEETLNEKEVYNEQFVSEEDDDDES